MNKPSTLPPAIIAAAGEGSRLREFMRTELDLPDDYPKHLLPTGNPGGETLLGRIVRQTSGDNFSDVPIVNTTTHAAHYILTHPDIAPTPRIDTERFVFSMDPFYYRVRRTGERVIACVGDFYSDINWQEFTRQHEESSAAVSLITHRASTPVQAAVFDIDTQTSRVTAIRRPTAGGQGEYCNVGAYIFDPVDALLAVFEQHLAEDPRDARADDSVFAGLIHAGLVGAVRLEGSHFNINTPREYQALLDHTQQSTPNTR